MCRFIETICVLDGVARHLPLHQERMDATLRHHFGRCVPSVNLSSLLNDVPPTEGKVKVRVVYGKDGVEEITHAPYRMRSVRSLKMVCADDADYRFKCTDRGDIERLYALRRDCDDILVVRRGLLTDTSFTNIALFIGHQWFTPAHPLLEGVMRRNLIDARQLVEAELTPADLHRAERVSLLNAMISLGELVVSPSQVIV